MEACLNCKSCRTICPAGVDVSELILQRRAEQRIKADGCLRSRPSCRYLNRYLSSWRRLSACGIVLAPARCLSVWRARVEAHRANGQIAADMVFAEARSAAFADRHPDLTGRFRPVAVRASPTSMVARRTIFDDGVGMR